MNDTARQQNEQQPEVPAKPLDKMTGNEARDFLYLGVRHELEECAKVVDAIGNRFTMEGKEKEAMVAIEIAAKIRARKPPQP